MATVLRGGRVIKPRGGHARGRSLVLSDGAGNLRRSGYSGDGALDVPGMIVGPGFIDLHSHVHSIAGQRLQASGGVTASLERKRDSCP